MHYCITSHTGGITWSPLKHLLNNFCPTLTSSSSIVTYYISLSILFLFSFLMLTFFHQVEICEKMSTVCIQGHTQESSSSEKVQRLSKQRDVNGGPHVFVFCFFSQKTSSCRGRKRSVHQRHSSQEVQRQVQLRRLQLLVALTSSDWFTSLYSAPAQSHLFMLKSFLL